MPNGDRPTEITERLDRPMAVLGIIFLLVVVGEGLAKPGTSLQIAFVVFGWLLWAAFAAEFILKIVVARDRKAFLLHRWWQALFLLLPFLRFLRVAALLRAARAGRVVSSAVRAGRSARSTLTARIGWLASISLIVILTSSQLLFEFGRSTSYAAALHDATFAAITGEPMSDASGFARVLELLLAAYSVIFFATLAGSLGAFFLERRSEMTTRDVATAAMTRGTGAAEPRRGPHTS